MKNLLSNLSKDSLINIIEDLNLTINNLECEANNAYIEIARLNIIILEEEFEEQRQAYYDKHDNDEIPNISWIDHGEEVSNDGCADDLAQCPSCGRLTFLDHGKGCPNCEKDREWTTNLPF